TPGTRFVPTAIGGGSRKARTRGADGRAQAPCTITASSRRPPKRHNRAPARRTILPAAADDDDVFAAAELIDRRRRVAGCGQRRLPQQLPGEFVEGAELLVEVRRTGD